MGIRTGYLVVSGLLLFAQTPWASPNQNKPNEEKAFADVREMMGRAIQTAIAIESSQDRTDLYSSILEIQLSIRDWHGASLIVEALQSADAKAKLLESKAYSELEKGEISTAADTALRMEDGNRKAAVFARIAFAQAKSGNNTAATATIRQVIQMPFSPSDKGDRSWALEQIARAQAKLGDLDGALRTAAAFRDTFTYADALGRIAGGCSDTRTLDDVLKVIATLPRSLDRTTALKVLAEDQIERGDLDPARKTADSIEDNDNRCQVLAAIARAQWARGDKTGATESVRAGVSAAKAIKDRFYRLLAIGGIVRTLAVWGDVLSAEKTLDEVNNDVTDNNALNDEVYASLLGEVALQQALLGNKSSAEVVFKRAVLAARRIPVHEHMIKAVRDIAVSQAKAGFPNAAIDTASAIDFDIYRSIVFTEVAKSQASSGNTKGALQTVEKLASGRFGSDFRRNIMNAIARAMANAGALKRAIAFAESLPSPYDRAQAFVGAAEGVMDRESRKGKVP